MMYDTINLTNLIQSFIQYSISSSPSTTTVRVFPLHFYLSIYEKMKSFQATRHCLSLTIWWTVIIGRSSGATVSNYNSHPTKNHRRQSPAIDTTLLIQRFRDILAHPVPFHDEDEEAKCKKMVGELDEEELRLAAQVSYAFWYLEQESDSCPPLVMKKQAALKEARRHLVASSGDVPKALQRLQDACQYRKEHNLNALRTCFHDDNEHGNASQSEQSLRMRDWVWNDMRSQPVIMKGHDTERRAVLFKGSRLVGGGTEDEYLTSQLYVAERANACSEFVSLGLQEKMVAVFDFSSYQSGNAPPLQWQLSAIRTIQHLYPERLHKLILLEPPFWMRGVYLGIRSFLPKSTQQKIQLVKNRNDLSDHLDMASMMMHTTLAATEDRGENSMETALIGYLDIDHYLKQVPFFCPYDCEEYLPRKEQ